MTSFIDVPLTTFFVPTNGRAKFVRDFVDRNPGPYPVYSASLLATFGTVDEYEYDGRYLTWVMNGYGGRVQEVAGRFSANRDRGVLVPRNDVVVPDLTYVRYNAEPMLVAAAVGRRVDGRANDYTKIYPIEAGEVTIPVPQTEQGQIDYGLMEKLGERYRRIEAAQRRITAARDALKRAIVPFPASEAFKTVSIGDKSLFSLCIGDRVLTSGHVDQGVPVYSANARAPFGIVAKSNLSNFSNPSLLWGIDGNFDWNFIEADLEFATTDHCGRLCVLDETISPFYVYHYLRSTRARYGFDRVYRASLGNMKANVTVDIPVHAGAGAFDRDRQNAVAAHMEQLSNAKERSLGLIAEVGRARVVAN